MKKIIYSLIASAATAGAAQAQTVSVGHPYIGVGAAFADHDYSLSGTGATNLDSKGWKANGKVFGGVELTENLAAEVGYTNLRGSDFSYTRNGSKAKGSSDGYGTYVAAKYNVPLNDQFSAYGKLGVEYSKRKANTSDGLSVKDHDTGAYGALGAEFKLNPKVSLVAEYERYGKSKDFGAKADVVTFGVKYSF